MIPGYLIKMTSRFGYILLCWADNEIFSFQNVLAALNIEHGDAGKEMSEVEKKANLEEISKKSKRRVHYQKFVRGKDLKNYSADDLGCILGTKSEKVKIAAESEPTNSPEEGSEESSGEEDSRFVQG